MGGGPFAEPTEAVHDRGVVPAAVRRGPARGREVMERHDRDEVVVTARRDHPPVVVERLGDHSPSSGSMRDHSSENR